jgi:pyruvoyl-dependent arginine decarboxylase (PvlArgDC)
MKLLHNDAYPDDKDILIVARANMKNTRQEQNNQVCDWMRKTGKIPFGYQAEKNGLHVEYSEAFEQKIKEILAKGTAIGMDKKEYTFVKPDQLFPLGNEICVKAKLVNEKFADSYGLSFFDVFVL